MKSSMYVCITWFLAKSVNEFLVLLTVPLEMLMPVMVSLPGQPCHISLSADELTLSVCLRESSVPCMLYDTRSFCEPVC